MTALPARLAELQSAWQVREAEREDALIAEHAAAFDARARLSSSVHAIARSGDLEGAHRAIVQWRFHCLLHPSAEIVDELLAPAEAAVLAYVEHVEGRAGEAERLLRQGIAANGALADRYGLGLRAAAQIHLATNLVRVLVEVDPAAATVLGERVLATAGDPTAWPFPDAPRDPWAAIPHDDAALLRGDVERRLAFARARCAAAI